MASAQSVQNPCALLLNPAAVLAEVERSGRLNRLASRICRPLDKPVLGVPEDEAVTQLPADTGWSLLPEDCSDIIR